MSLVDTSWLENNIEKVKIIDCSWHMPQTQRNGFEEYTEEHIPNAIFFDLDKNSKLDTDLPHMLTCLLYTSPSPRDRQKSRMPSSA